MHDDIAAFADAQSAARERAYDQHLAFLKAEAQRAGFMWPSVVYHAIPCAFREQAGFDRNAPAPFLLDYIDRWLTLPRCGRCHIPTQSTCKRCKTPYCDVCCCWHGMPVCLGCHVILLHEDKEKSIC